MTVSRAPRWKLLLAFLAIYLIWGTTYIAIIFGLRTMHAFMIAGFRFMLAGGIMLAVAAFRGERVFNRFIPRNMVIGVIALTGGQGLLVWAEKYISSGLTAILVSTLPLWYVLFDSRNRKKYFSDKLVIAGLGVGFAGILLLFGKYLTGQAPPGGNSIALIATFVVILSCFCWVGGTLYFRYNPSPGSLFLNLGWQLAGAMIAAFIVNALTESPGAFDLGRASITAWLSVAYLAVAGSIGAFVAYNWLITVRPAAIVGTYAYVNPVIAVLLGIALANEQVNAYQVAGMIVILVSAFFVNFRSYRQSAEERKAAAKK